MLLQPRSDGTTLASEFSCLIKDNASIHKEPAFLLKLRSHIQVKFIPAYCYHLSPLDNGAYGLVVNWLKATAHRYGHEPIKVQLTRAFRSISQDAARWCFHNCKYLF